MARPEKHGASSGGKRTSEYLAWNGAKRRVTNPRCSQWARYGGRGIDMDPRWLESFEAFLSDVGPKPSHELTLDRIDNSKGYWPGNVRWATWEEQAGNRTPRKRDPKTLRSRADAAGIDYHTAYQRIHVLGWDESRALSTPPVLRAQWSDRVAG